MKTIDFSYFIERFISGDMDETEKQWFLKEMDGNPELRREVDLRNRTEKVLRNPDIMKLRKKLTEIEGKNAARYTSVRNGSFKYAAAVAIFVIAGGIAIYSTRNHPGNDQIIERYYGGYEASVNTRSGNNSDNPDFNLALEYYNVHDYKNAAIFFSKVVNEEPGNIHSTFLNGVSNFEINNFPEAKSSFSKVINDNNNLFIDHAEWYLALCYIKTNEQALAERQLEKIAGSESIYRKSARKVLRRLK